eukprot:g12046.t1
MEYRNNDHLDTELACRMKTEGGGRDLLFRLEVCDRQGPLLLVVYINDLDVNVGGMVSKFADDTKIRGVVDTEDSYLRVQQDLDHMGQWAEKWQMEFNLDK